MWQYLQRFPHYEELKELHNKFLPELAKMEQQIGDFKLDMEQHQLMIRRFDEDICHKGSKEAITSIYQTIKKECATKEEQQQFLKKVEDISKQTEHKSKELSKNFELISKNLSNKMTIQLLQATKHLQNDDDGTYDAVPAAGGKGKPESVTRSNLLKSIENKVDQHDFKVELSEKTSKLESEMMLRQIEIQHR